MSRINAVSPTDANEEQAELYAAITAQLGMVPNFLKVFAHSPTALRAFLGLHRVASEGSLDPLTKERIALGLAEHNGAITNTELLEIRNAGYSESDIIEIITHVGMNVLTNIVSKASQVEIDFPKVELNM
jgi:alkylhydroperoxidase family enzyme